MRIKDRFLEWSKKYEFINNLVRNYGMRTIVFAIGSFAISIAYGAYNLTLSALERSIWYGVLAGYYILLAFMRGGVVRYHQKRSKRERIGKVENEEAKQIKKYRNCGALLMVMTLALSFAILQIVSDGKTFKHAGLMIYVSATYTFYKITIAIIQIVKAKKQPDVTVQAIRNINLADAMVSILALQTSMFNSFDKGDSSKFPSTMNAVTGAVVCALVLALGIYMVVKSKRLLDGLSEREQESGNTDEDGEKEVEENK